jgi:hypothetical protein
MHLCGNPLLHTNLNVKRNTALILLYLGLFVIAFYEFNTFGMFTSLQMAY